MEIVNVWSTGFRGTQEQDSGNVTTRLEGGYKVRAGAVAQVRRSARPGYAVEIGSGQPTLLPHLHESRGIAHRQDERYFKRGAQAPIDIIGIQGWEMFLKHITENGDHDRVVHINDPEMVADPFTKYLTIAVWNRHMLYVLNNKGWIEAWGK